MKAASKKPALSVLRLLVALSLFSPLNSHAAERKEERPNILLILVDDLGYGELGCQGNREIPTPHIDSLAASGVRCTSGYVTASYCSPSRAGLLTGRYQTRFGHELNPVGKHNLDPQAGLPLTEITVAEHLQKCGYVTALAGKWHLGGADQHHPMRQGFDECYGFLHEGHYYAPPPYRGMTSFLRRKTLPNGAARMREGDTIWTSHMGYDEPPYDADNPILRGRTAVETPPNLTDAFTREAIAFIERHKTKPFFLYLSYNAVHSPMQGAAKYMERFAHIDDIHRRVFAAMLAQLDDSVGAVLHKLQELRLERRTLVFFISDNGGPTKELTSSNRPLRGGKGDLYEGGVRVPFLVQWTGRLPAGVVYDRPVIATDVFTTASAAAGAPPPSDRWMDGVDLAPYLSGGEERPPHELLYWRMGRRTAIRRGDWKIVRNGRGGANGQGFELYNLAKDIGETTDLSKRHPEKLRELQSDWERIDQQMVNPAWTPNSVSRRPLPERRRVHGPRHGDVQHRPHPNGAGLETHES